MQIRGLLAVATMLAAVPGPVLCATGEELHDLESKAHYAFLTEDANALQGLASGMQVLAGSEEPLDLYHYAHVRFRQLQLATFAGRRSEAAAAGEACVAALDRAVIRDPAFAEGLALQANCLAYLAALQPVAGLPSAARAAMRAATALKLNPRNPRVQLAEAAALYFRPASLGGDRRRALPLFERTVQSFGIVVAARAGEPTWGAAEAWFLLGRAREDVGDVLAARDAYEQALLEAPEFARARQRLAGLTGR